MRGLSAGSSAQYRAGRLLGASDRIRDLHELVPEVESLRQQLAEPADAEGLGRVVAAREYGDAGLARVGHERLLRLARHERVDAQPHGLGEAGAAAAGHHSDGPDRPAVALEDQRLAAKGGGAALGELRQLDRLRRVADEADRAAAHLAVGLPAAELERLADQRVVPHLGVSI